MSDPPGIPLDAPCPATSGAPGYWGSEFHYSASGTGADTITWTPALTTAGTYRVYARWTYNLNRVTNAPYTIHHAGGATTIRVNREQKGAETGSATVLLSSVF